MRRPLAVLIALASASAASAAAAQSDQSASSAVAGATGAPHGKEDLTQTPVTGSLLPRDQLPATPGTELVLTRKQWDQSGKFALGDFLQTIPEDGNAPNLQRNNGGADYNADGATRINLRSLGLERSLVLVDGRRMVSSGLGASTTVDINTAPDAAVDRVEILKDGASAIYGSGAIAGVVNIITRRGFEGSEARVNFGSSSRGDAQTVDVDYINGHGNDRGSYLLTLSYFKQNPAYFADRSWSARALDYDFTSLTPSASGSSRVPQGSIRVPEDYFFNPGYPVASCLANPLCNSMVSSLGWTPSTRYIRDPSAPLGWRLFNNGDFYNFAGPNYLYTPTQRAQVFLDGDFKFDNVRAYYQAYYTWHASEQNAAPMPFNPGDYLFGVASADNLYNPFGTDLDFVGRRLVEFGPRTYRQTLGTYRLVAGLQGSFGPGGPLSGWSWDLAANYGRSSGSFDTDGSFRNSRVAAAIGPSILVAGVPRCVSTPGDASSVIAGCVPLNLFGGPGSIDSAQLGYLGFHGKTSVDDSLVSVTANMSGALFSLPSGRNAQLAIGYEFRREQGAEIADAVIAAGDSADFNFSSTRGAQTSQEVHAELSLPMIVDMPLAKLFEVDFAGGYANYDTSGSNISFKVTAQKVSASGWTFLTTYARSFRAPNIREMFGGSSQTTDAATDPCAYLSIVPANVAAQCVATGVPPLGSFDFGLQELVNRGGDPHVRPEISDTFRAGLTYQPPRFAGLAFTLDWYSIRVADVIATPLATTLLQRCYPDQGTPDPQACSRIVRDGGTGQIQYIDGRALNDGSLVTTGLDFGMQAEFGTSIGDLGFALNGSWIGRFDRTESGLATVHGVGNRDLGAIPSMKANVEATWRRGGWAARLGGRYVGSFKQCSNLADPTTAVDGLCGGTNPFFRKISPSIVVDAQASYNLQRWAMGQTKVTIGVNNLFDRAPPTIYGAPTSNSDPMLYDFIGRFGYIRITHIFD